MDDIYKQFIDKLIKDKGETEAKKFLTSLAEYGAEHLYITMLTTLSEEDMQAIENISDEKEAEAEAIKRFQAKTGKTPEEFLKGLQQVYAASYLHPELFEPGKPQK